MELSSSNTGSDEILMLPSRFDKDILFNRICLLSCSVEEPDSGTRELRDVDKLWSVVFARPLGVNRPFSFS